MGQGMNGKSFCTRCGGLVMVKRRIDMLGNHVESLGCSNGHYEEIISTDHFPLEQDRVVETEEAIAYIGFFTIR